MNAIINRKSKRSDLVKALMMLVDQLPQLLPNATFVVKGVKMTTAQIVKQDQDLLAAIKGTDAARASTTNAVRTESKLRDSATASTMAIRSYVVGALGDGSAESDALGFEPKKKAKPTAQVKAEGVVKSKATRQARHTMGKNQKKTVKGVATAAPNATKP